MAYEYSEALNDEWEERFIKLEPQVSKISYKIMILMENLEGNFKPFSEFCTLTSSLA